jgi:hypothetical protein
MKKTEGLYFLHGPSNAPLQYYVLKQRQNNNRWVHTYINMDAVNVSPIQCSYVAGSYFLLFVFVASGYFSTSLSLLFILLSFIPICIYYFLCKAC